MKKSICNQLRRCNVPPNHMPVSSLISQQRCHPRAGHDSPRNKGIAGLHVAKNTQKHTSKPTKLGLSGHQGVGKGLLLSWWAHYRAKKTYTGTSLTSKTPTHTQHKESVPSLLHSPSGPAFPSSAIQGLWRRIHPSSSVFVVSRHQVYEEKQAPIPAPNIVRRTNIACMQSISSYSLNKEDGSWVVLGPIVAKMTPKQPIAVYKRW